MVIFPFFNLEIITPFNDQFVFKNWIYWLWKSEIFFDDFFNFIVQKSLHGSFLGKIVNQGNCDSFKCKETFSQCKNMT